MSHTTAKDADVPAHNRGTDSRKPQDDEWDEVAGGPVDETDDGSPAAPGDIGE